MSSIVDVPKQNPDALKKAVANGPVGSSIDGNNDMFRNYAGGIIDSGCTTARNHAIVIIGYGSEDGRDYWLCKNSLGADWGEQGFFRILNTGEYNDGMCGIAAEPSYPLL